MKAHVIPTHQEHGMVFLFVQKARLEAAIVPLSYGVGLQEVMTTHVQGYIQNTYLRVSWSTKSMRLMVACVSVTY